MRKMVAVFIVLVLSGCVSFEPAVGRPSGALYYAGGDGFSFKRAVSFPGARSSAQGIALERQWLAEQYPGYQRKSRREIRHDQRIFDRVEIVTADGEEKVLFFDMTNWASFPSISG